MTIILQILKKLPLKVPLSAVEGRFEVTFLSKALFYRDLRKTPSEILLLRILCFAESTIPT